MQKKVLIQGAGEQASGTAHRLFRCGFQVVMTDLASPTAVRRAVSFCSATEGEEIVVEGVRAVGYELGRAGMLQSFGWTHIPVFVDPQCSLRTIWQPDVLIDGRILKINAGNSMTHAPLVIGFGPGLAAGRDVHYVVETQRGHELGKIITEGMAAPNTGIPGAIGGYTSQRVVRAPHGGVFRTSKRIGEMAERGEEIGRVDAGVVTASVATASVVTASVAGVVRGLLRSGASVVAGQKLGDIDPRGDIACCHTISDKARTISGSALEIILAFFNRGCTS